MLRELRVAVRRVCHEVCATVQLQQHTWVLGRSCTRAARVGGREDDRVPWYHDRAEISQGSARCALGRSCYTEDAPGNLAAGRGCQLN